MQLIDTHCHLYSYEFDEDRNDMFSRAKGSGVSHFLLPSIDRSYSNALFNLEEEQSDCFAMMGVHPCSIQKTYKEELQFAEKQLTKREFIGIGEIGLDYYWSTDFKDKQKRAFHTQLNWAKELKKPASMHVRSSEDDFLAMIKEEQDGNLLGVWHCFSGTLQQGKQAIDLGLKLGIGGVVTFKNGKIDQFLHKIPIEHIVLETDAPYLSPSPLRGKRNESAHLIWIIKKLAALYSIPVEEVAKRTTKTASGLFDCK